MAKANVPTPVSLREPTAQLAFAKLCNGRARRPATGTAVIQCKFHFHPIGYDAVKEAYTAKAIYHATAAFVVSNAAFTTQARKAARQLNVTLANHGEIAALLQVE